MSVTTATPATEYTDDELRRLMITPKLYYADPSIVDSLACTPDGVERLVKLLAELEPGYQALLDEAAAHRYDSNRGYCCITHFTDAFYQRLSALLGQSVHLQAYLEACEAKSKGLPWNGVRPKWSGTYLSSDRAWDVAREGIIAALPDCKFADQCAYCSRYLPDAPPPANYGDRSRSYIGAAS